MGTIAVALCLHRDAPLASLRVQTPEGLVRTVAAFDFDGTLAKGDSLIPFLLRLLGGRKVARSVLAHAPSFAAIGIGRGNRDTTKERFIAHILSGHPAEEIIELGKTFADDLIDTRLFPEVVQRVEWHKAEGHQLVLVSASLDVFLKPLTKKLGFDGSVTTRLEIANGKATGRLVGANVRAAEKVRRLDEWLGLTEPDGLELWAYGNSSGDYELLERANRPFWVTKRGDVEPWPGRRA